MKHIHFVGIKGVGMTPLALMAKQAGHFVTGSDIPTQFITDEVLMHAGITVFPSFDSNHIEGADLVITTGAHGGFQNPEVIVANQKGISVWTQGEAVGRFMEGAVFGRTFTGISVCGTHGKTTTTAMVATMFKENKLDPSYIVGTSSIQSLGHPGHFGTGNYFVAEADEYVTEPVHDMTPKLFWQHPQIAILTSIDYDHPDVYSSLEDVEQMFQKFLETMPMDGRIVACGDDPSIKKILSTVKAPVTTYGLGADNDIVVERISVINGKTRGWLVEKEQVLGQLTIAVSGEHNMLNATAAAIVGLHGGLSFEEVSQAIAAFSGTKRRFEFLGSLAHGALLYDDYAHHPTEIQKTLQAFRDQFPNKHIVCIFQPHTFSRTKQLFDEFTHAFAIADAVIITDIYASLREEPDASVSSEMLVQQIQNKNTQYLPTLADVVAHVKEQQYGEDTVVVTMGAGDIYTVGKNLEMQE